MACACPEPASAQWTRLVTRLPFSTLVPMGSVAEDELRLDQLRGAAPDGWLLRSSSHMLTPLAGASLRLGSDARGCDARWSLVAPSGNVTWNSRLPLERNEGGVWSARGLTLHGAGGLRAECGRVRLVIVPDGWIAQNRAFAHLSSPSSGRSSFVHPFYGGREASLDMPIRFGTSAQIVAQLGQSFVDADLGAVSVTAGAQSQWWGPGMRNALVMSNHAASIPALALRTTQPLRTRAGTIEGHWMVGALTESPYFDYDVANDLRSLSGLVVTLSPAFDSTLTLGAARVVYAPISAATAVPGRFFDPVTSWGDRRTDGEPSDQITSLFLRWLFPAAGAEAYAEWARAVLPNSLRELLLDPQYGQGYTLGAQWLSTPDSLATAWRAQVEVTMNEQPRFTPGEPPAFYVSATGGHGYTQRGRVVGALIGPGGNAQFLGVDRRARNWSAGVTLGRTRWNNEQYYRRPTAVLGFAHDVSMYTGLRGWYRLGNTYLSAEVVREKRMNYLFQSAVGGYGEDRTFDVRNTSFRLSITPR
jgi:hypothetical protein